MGELFWSIAGLFGVGGTLAALGILGWQAFFWLKSGQWPLLATQDFFTYLAIKPPSTDWLGLQKMINGILEGPLSMTAFCGGILVAGIFVYLAEKVEKAAWERQKLERASERNKNTVQ